MFKPSQYNVEFRNNQGELLLTNTRTCKRVKFAYDDISIVESLLACEENGAKIKQPIFQYLLYNEFILPIDYDEYRWIELKYNQMLYDTGFLSVTIIPTLNCNFRCVYCYETPEQKYMNRDTINRVKKFFAKKIKRCKQVKISWFGGEPLLCKDILLEIMEYVDSICKKEGAALAGTINTNGYLLDIETFKKMTSYRLRTFEICVDGTKQIHNKQRPHYLYKDSYETIIENLLNIKNYTKTNTFKIGIRVNITPEILPVLDEHIKQIASYFSNDSRFYISFQGVRDWGGTRVDSKMVLGTDNEKGVHKTLYEKAQEAGIQSIEIMPIIPFAGYCDANKDNGYIINFDGTLHKCSIAMYEPKFKEVNSIGFIDEYGNTVVDDEKLSQWLIRPTEIRNSCKDCKLYPLCVDGSCPYQRNIQNHYRCNPIYEMYKSQILCFDSINKIPYYERID